MRSHDTIEDKSRFCNRRIYCLKSNSNLLSLAKFGTRPEVVGTHKFFTIIIPIQKVQHVLSNVIYFCWWVKQKRII